MSEFEVWCNHCDVTFPVKTPRCLHCGGRTSPERLQRSMRDVDPMALRDASRPMLATDPDSFHQIIEEGPVEAVDEEPGGRSLLRAGMSVIWMILLAAGYLWKSCTE